MLDLTNVQVYLPILVGVVLPALVALVTKQVSSSRFKSLALVALSAVSSVVVPLVGATTVDFQAVANNFLVIFGSGVLAYYGVLKPTGVTEAVQTAVPGGLGTSEALPGPEFDEFDDVEVVGEDAVDGPTEGEG
jgi:hypothetical protein